MFRAAVIYAPASQPMQSLAERVAAALDRRRFVVTLKPAAQAAITDLSASDLLLLGAAPEGKATVHPDFAELLRALAGINLAGRVAGLFTPAGEASLQALKRALKDTDIQLEPENLLPADESHGSKELARWLGRLAGQLESAAHGR
jgi:flavodoxin